MLSVRTLASAALALAAAAPLQASAYVWTICNKSPENLRIAIAYRDLDNRWISRGWWSVRACGGCANVLNLAKTDTVDQFYRAVSDDGRERLAGDTRFCVAPSGGFQLANGGRCPGGYTAAGFRRVPVEYSNRDFTSNINAAPGGRVCID